MDNPAHSDFGRLRSALLNTHLTDLKEITHDFLYENYRTETLSRNRGDTSYGAAGEGFEGDGSSILPGDLVNQSVRLKEEQLRREGTSALLFSVLLRRLIHFLLPPPFSPHLSLNTDDTERRTEDKLRESELRSQREISEKRQELLAKEESLRNLESRLANAQQLQYSTANSNGGVNESGYGGANGGNGNGNGNGGHRD